MSLPEKLIKSAKAGNLREVRKMLGRNVQITKDKVGYRSRNNMHVKTSLCNQYTYIWRIHMCKKRLVIRALKFTVWKYCTSWSCVEWSQWYRQGTSQCILLCGQHQQLWIYSPALGQPKWPRQSRENSAQMASRYITPESGVQMRVHVLIHHIERGIVLFLPQHGETALHLAAKYNHSTVISVLASFKVNMDVRGKVYMKYCDTIFSPEMKFLLFRMPCCCF